MATVIKAESVSRTTLRAFNLNDIEAEARRLVETARRQANDLTAEATRQATRIREEARRAGFEQGRTEGLARGRKEGHDEALQQATERFSTAQAGLIEAMGRAIAEFDAQKLRLLLAARTDVIDLAVAIARRVVKRVGEIDPNVAAANVAEALAIVGPRTDAVVHVHPRDLESVSTFAAELAAKAREARHVEVVADNQVSPGGCVLTTREGAVDATLPVQLERIVDLLVPQKRAEAAAPDGATPDATDDSSSPSSDAPGTTDGANEGT